MNVLDIPTFSQEDRDMLELPITIEELDEVLGSMSNDKASVSDCLPAKINKKYKHN